ncbi:MAG: DsbA family protein [Hyphomicrobiaceae bacterium]
MAAAASAQRLTGVALAMLLSLAGGCSGDVSSLATQTTVTGAAGSGGAYAGAASADRSAAPFNPFAPEGASDLRLREVIAKPTLAQIHAPPPLPEFSLGRADAPVVMVKYMSLTCQYCRRFMAETFPILKKDYIDTGKVRLIIREFPIGKSSGNATIALRCAPMDKYLTLYQKFLQQQAQWVAQEVRTDAIFKVASEVGMKREQFDACMKNQSMIEALKQVKDRGRQLGIIGTPNFFIGDKLVKNVIGMPEIRAIVDPMLGAGASPGARLARTPGAG